MQAWLFVFLGCGFGGITRYGMLLLTRAIYPHNFPLGTLLVNITGSLIAGIFIILFLKKMPQHVAIWHPLLLVGFLGGYTTFSTFALETVQMMQDGLWLTAVFYISLSIIFCVLAAAAGMWIGKQF